MSRFNDPRYLENQLARVHEGGLVLDRDRTCKGCGYDLTGLCYGGVCPECGKQIRFGRAMQIPERDRLQDAPVWYIRLTQVAFATMAVSSVGLIGLTLVLLGSLSSVWPREIAAMTTLPLTLLWLAGVVALALPRPSTERVRRDGRDEWRIRLASVATQGAWPVAALLAALPDGAVVAMGRPWNALAAQAAALIGLAGVGVLAWLLASHSEWMQDDDGAPRLRRRTFWLLTLGAVIMVGGTFHVPIPVGSLQLMAGGVNILPFFALYLVIVMVWSFAGLSRGAAWSLRAKRTDAARTERLRRQREADSAAERERLRNAPIEPAPTYWKPPGPPRQSGHGGPDRVAGADGRR